MKEERKIERRAEEILQAYGEELRQQDAAAFDAILAEDEDYRKYEKLYGKRRFQSPRKRILRYAAILLAAIFVASIAVPVPKASAWRIWWLDLLTGESDVDMQVDAENAYDFVEYYPGKLPEGFELVSENVIEGMKLVTKFENREGKYILFRQQDAEKASAYVDNEYSDTSIDIIGNFETIVTYSGDDVVFEFKTEHTVNYIHTNAGYDIGKFFIKNLERK